MSKFDSISVGLNWDYFRAKLAQRGKTKQKYIKT